VTVLGFILALVIGLSLGLLGGGGSILTVPVLVYVLQYGMKQAVPMSLVVVGVTSLFGAVSHHRLSNVRWNAALTFGPAAIVGAVVGARLVAPHVSSRVQLILFAILMLVAAVSMFFGPALWGGKGVEETTRPRRSLVGTAVLGGMVGFLTGFIGVGGGFLYVPALVLMGGLAMKEAVGTSLVLIIMSCIAGFISYLGMVTIDWGATGLFTLLAIVGVLAGSRLGTRVSHADLRRGFAALLVVMGIVVLLKPR